jgi:hypothetical protein
MTRARASPRGRKGKPRVRAEFARIPWNAKQLVCNRCGNTESVPPDLLLRFRLRTCLPCLVALSR